MNKYLLLTLLALGYQSASAESLLETFGSGANQFTMEFVTIGNPGNAADNTGSPSTNEFPSGFGGQPGAGSVAYTYNLGKHEVGKDMITKANSAGNLGISLLDNGGNVTNRPATGVNWYEAATYVNWLNTSTGGTAAYKFVGGTFQLWAPTDAGYNANNMFRNSLAKYVIASRDEWYKGAYGKEDGTWYDYPTGSNIEPTAVASGAAANTAVYNRSGGGAGPADITNAGGLSPWGTMAQGGNVSEWNETAGDGTNDTADENRVLRGGAWGHYSNTFNASGRNESGPTFEYNALGFRVASVPEPSALSLLAIGLSGLALVRRRKQS